MDAPRISPILVILCLSTTLVFADGTDPEVGDVGDHLRKSFDLYTAGNFEQSLKSAEAALEMTERHAAIAYNNICSARMRMGALDGAAEACNRAVQLVPGYERAWSNLAWVYSRLAEQAPTVGTYLNLSAAHYWQGAIDSSIDAAESALELDPRNAIAHNNICAAHAKNGDWKLAIKQCRMALRIDPGYTLAKNNLEWAKDRTP